MKSRVIVSAVIEKGDELLFAYKPQNVGPYANTAHLIGGGVNLGEEKLDEALLREIKEESGIKVEIIETLGFDEDITNDKHGEKMHYVFLVYRMRYVSGELKPGSDIERLKWVSKDKLHEIPLNLPSQRLFERIGYLK